MEELLPLHVFHRHAKRVVRRAAYLGGAFFALFGLGAGAMAGIPHLGIVGGLGASLLAGGGAFAAWVLLWGGTMWRFQRRTIDRAYDADPALVGPSPGHEYRYRLPLCYDVSSGTPVTGTLYVGPQDAVFVPHRRARKTTPISRFSIEGSELRVGRWEDVPLPSRILGLDELGRLDFVRSGEVRRFLTIEAEQVASRLAACLPVAHDGSARALGNPSPT